MPLEHLIVHQLDPTVHAAGGTRGVITDLVRFAPEGHEFSIIGIDLAGRQRLGRWEAVEIDGRRIRFLPVARVAADAGRRRVPNTARLVAGLFRYRVPTGRAILQAHRAEVGAVLAALYPRRPLVQFIHSDWEAALESNAETFWRFMPRTHLLIERVVARRADRTIVFSRTASERLGRRSSRVEPARSWFDPSAFYPGRPQREGPLRIGWIGRFEHQKDPMKFVQVLACLARRSVRFTAWLAGAGVLERDLRAATAAEGLDECTEFAGTVSPQALAERLRSTDVLLMTSLVEGFPRAMVEALACGVPVVSTPVGDAVNVLRDGQNGFVAKGSSPDELAALVIRAHELPAGPQIAATAAAFDAHTVVAEVFDRISSSLPDQSADVGRVPSITSWR